MSKRTLLLITFLVIAAAGLLYIAISNNQKPVAPKNVNYSPTVAVPTVAQTNKDSILTIIPNPLIVSSSSGSIDINLQTLQNKVTAVQLELQYDPKVITITSITPATFFQNPLELLKIIDVKNGRISYALATPPAQTASAKSGIIATINFEIIPNAAVSQTQISFLPRSLVTAEGESESVLKSTSDATIIINK